MALQEKIAAFDACTFKSCFCITSEFLKQSLVVIVVLWNGQVSQMQLMLIKSFATFPVNNNYYWFMVSLHPSSCGCAREAAKHEGSVRLA